MYVFMIMQLITLFDSHYISYDCYRLSLSLMVVHSWQSLNFGLLKRVCSCMLLENLLIGCVYDVLQGNAGSSSSSKTGNNVTALLDLSFLVSYVNAVL